MIIRIAVGLKSPDPAAITALSTMRRVMPEISPEFLQRYDFWEFDVDSGGGDMIARMIEHYTDIVNPNKQKCYIYGSDNFPDKHDKKFKWVEFVVRDHDDSVSANWTSILSKSSFPILGVKYAVLWRIGFIMYGSEDELVKRAMMLSRTSFRGKGLLCNPVSQNLELLNI